MTISLPAGVQRVSHVREIQIRKTLEVISEIRDHRLESCRSFCRQRQDLIRSSSVVRVVDGSLLENHVNVCSTDPERAHRTATRTRIPLLQSVVDVKGTVDKID